MKNIKIYCSWELEFDLYHEKQIELYIDSIPSNPIPKDTVRFVFLLEPPEIQDFSQHAIHGMKSNTYDYLLTHNQKLIDECPNAHLFPYGTTWIKDYKFPEKEYGVSALVGGKLMAPGHHLRQILWFRQKRITNPPTKFYLSGNFGGIDNYNNNPVLGNDKKPLFDTQFHICIENTKRDNWFTEKLIDCLITKTIPIYWGCPNIGNWFNLDGFIIVDSLDDIVKSCNSLTETTYQEKLKAVEENYEISKKYANIGDRFISTINELITK